MKYISALVLASFVMACSIIEDEDFDSVPSSSDIKRIQISAWDGNNMATLTGTVDHTPSEITVKWAGLFNPFWLPDRPASFQFAMDNGKLQTATYTTVSGDTNRGVFIQY
jgi:hypothetical protein